MNFKFWLPITIALWTACQKSEPVPAPASAAAPSSSAQAQASGEMTLEDALKSGEIQNENTDSVSAPQFATLNSTAPAPSPAPAPAAASPTPSSSSAVSSAKALSSSSPAQTGAKPKTLTSNPAKAIPTAAQPQGTHGSYVLQVKASSDRVEIARDQDKLSKKGIKTYIVTLNNGGNPVYRLRIGSFASPAEARQYGNAQLNPMGYSFWVDQKSNETKGNP